MNKKRVTLVVLMLSALFFLTPIYAKAARKGSISYTVKNGVLKIYGKGEITSTINVKNSKKIKKIVVEEGITSIPIGEFRCFKKVKEVVIAKSVKKIGVGSMPESKYIKKITMPGKFKLVTMRDETLCVNYDLTWNEKTKIDKIVFNTPFDVKTASYIASNDLIVSKKDPKFKSVDGVIYTKDGKSIVRVPANRKVIKVLDGCEEFCLQAVQYCAIGEEEIEYRQCSKLEKIILPSSIKKVSKEKYTHFYEWCWEREHKKLVVNTQKLESDALFLLKEEFELDSEYFMNHILHSLEYVICEDGMYINSRDFCLLAYDGKMDEVYIPDGIKKIGYEAFSDSKIKKIVMPESVQEIDDYAFWYSKELQEIQFPSTLKKIGESSVAYCSKLKKVVLPENLKNIPKKLFYKCKALEEITLPKSVTTIEGKAFYRTKISPTILQESNVNTIKKDAFSYIDVEELILPATLKRMEDSPFPVSSLKKVTICGSTKHMNPFAFFYAEGLTMCYLAEVKEWQTALWAEILKKGKKSAYYMNLSWQKIQGVSGYQIDVASNKRFKKNKKTYYVEPDMVQTKIKLKKKNVKYVRIRPYKIVDGKKAFGRWTEAS